MAGYKISNQNALHFLTLTTVGWVDVFTRQRYRDILLDSLAYLKGCCCCSGIMPVLIKITACISSGKVITTLLNCTARILFSSDWRTSIRTRCAPVGWKRLSITGTVAQLIMLEARACWISRSSILHLRLDMCMWVIWIRSICSSCFRC